MRKKIVAGNWKMNTSFEEAKNLIASIKKNSISNNVEVIVSPPIVFCQAIGQLLQSTPIRLGAQNCSEHQAGAYTGEVSAAMLQSVGVNYVIIGHSERRTYYHETDAIIAKKINQAINSNLQPIFCCGEYNSEREKNKHFEVVEKQLKNGLFHLLEADFRKIIIAYEPVWAIGTGVTASAEQAQEMHAFIRKVIADNYTNEVSQCCSIIYGGSCNASNAKSLFSNLDIDGGLIGGASLNSSDFSAIINSF